MDKRSVIRVVLDGKQPPYVPWSFGFTKEAKAKLQEHYQQTDLEPVLQNHLLKLGSDIGFFSDAGGDDVQDVFGVVWDRWRTCWFLSRKPRIKRIYDFFFWHSQMKKS